MKKLTLVCLVSCSFLFFNCGGEKEEMDSSKSETKENLVQEEISPEEEVKEEQPKESEKKVEETKTVMIEEGKWYCDDFRLKKEGYKKYFFVTKVKKSKEYSYEYRTSEEFKFYPSTKVYECRPGGFSTQWFNNNPMFTPDVILSEVSVSDINKIHPKKFIGESQWDEYMNLDYVPKIVVDNNGDYSENWNINSSNYKVEKN